MFKKDLISRPKSSCIVFFMNILVCLFRYDSGTGTFTVPLGEDGYYYFSAYFVVWYYKFARFDIQINGETICTAFADRSNSGYQDRGHTSCIAVTYAAEGKTCKKLTKCLNHKIHMIVI